MSIISASDTGGAADLPEIANSLRFNGSSNKLTRTPTSAGNGQKWTVSAWIKRTKLGVQRTWFASGTTGTLLRLGFAANDTFELGYPGIGVNNSTEKYRDTTSWYHFVVSCDTSLATANIIKVWCNNQAVTITNTILGTGGTTAFNSATLHEIGYDQWVALYNDIMLSNVVMVDGQALTPSSFGYTDPNGQWRSLSKAALTTLASAGGTNSFFLPFDNGSSTTILGYDTSSKGNNWTLTNMVRDGSVNDCWSYDTPTNNFATLNPLRAGTVPSNGALTHATGTQYLMDATYLMTTGKWYWEVVYSAPVSVYPICGIHSGADFAVSKYTGQDTTGYGLGSDGSLYYSAAPVAVYSAIGTNGVAMFAYDADTGKLWTGANGTWFNSGNPVAGTGQVATAAWYASGSYPSITAYSSSTANANFGQRPVSGGAFDTAAGGYFRYTPPSGFKALCTKNLPSSGSVTISGTFTGNAAADGPFVWLNGTPTAMTIDGNAVTWGTHADKLANGFKIRTASSPYNDAASNSYSVTFNDGIFKFNNAEKNL